MWTLLASALAILLFLVSFYGLGVVRVARDALDRMRASVTVMRDRDLDDDDKEAAVRQAGIALLGATASILVRSAGCLLISAAPIYGFAALGLTTVDGVFAFLLRWDVIVVTSVAIAAGMYWAARGGDAASGYSPMDRAVHGLAYSRPFVQLAASDLEDTLFRRDIERVADRPPVFVTSLPRAGTTVLLTALHGVPGVATHLYRDMPFVMAPLLWSRLSGGFAKSSELRERAHGDGIQVGYDSPEAFEEVLWRAFWPQKYRPDRIELWGPGDLDADASEFFRRHFRKLVALRCGGNGRYVSKNNGNIARLALLPAMFPGARIVVPLRQPIEHAASLLRQHENFAARHARDRFVKRYMRDIGHLEFGELHTPFDFDGFGELAAGLGPGDPDYWLAYWIAGYREVLARAGGLHLVPQDALGDRPGPTMEALCRAIGVDPGETDFTDHFRPVAGRADAGRFDPALVATARDIYEALRDAAANRA